MPLMSALFAMVCFSITRIFKLLKIVIADMEWCGMAKNLYMAFKHGYQKTPQNRCCHPKTQQSNCWSPTIDRRRQRRPRRQRVTVNFTTCWQKSGPGDTRPDVGRAAQWSHRVRAFHNVMEWECSQSCLMNWLNESLPAWPEQWPTLERGLN